MKCLHCQGEMFRGGAPFHFDRQGVHVSLDNVPAWVCTKCGEPLFEETEVNAIQELMEAVDKQTSKLVVPSAP
jgi:YgiT-type zinc finger domain-containing protein